MDTSRVRKDHSRTRLRELAQAKPQYGYRFLHELLQREGHAVNRKRVYRLYRDAGLAVRRRKLRIVRAMPPVALTRPNERWAMDFVHDLHRELERRRRSPTHAEKTCSVNRVTSN
jgi:transposase InsO family protein